MDIPDDQWEVTSLPGPLTETDVDLWRVDLNYDSECVGSHFKLLSVVEKKRANRYVFPKDRNHFIMGRAKLRKLLAGYLEMAPEKIKLSTGRYGKPFLSGEGTRLKFNVSHSKGIAAIAVSQNREVGVDIEFVNSDFDVFSVVSGVFSRAGISRLRATPSKLRARAFFAGWTRKEALLKAVGDGLSSSEDVHSAILPINDKDLTDRASAYIEGTNWSLTPFEIREDFSAALVIEGNIGTVKFLQLNQT